VKLEFEMTSANQAVPRLLYHTLSATLHPSNTTDSVLTIRFSTPVRIESLRIIPEGVPTLSGIGCTYPSNFTAKVLFNVSPSNPVNALSGTTIDYDDEGWEQDYKIGMPEGVSTRMMVIVGKIDRLSLSVYGYASGLTEATDVSMADKQEKAEGAREKEDWSWISEWAGGVSNLIQMLVGGVSPDKREKAMDCLQLLAEVDPTINDQIIRHPTAISYLRAHDSAPRPLLQNLCDDPRYPRYALHPNLRDLLPYGHRYKALVEGSEASRRDAAWALIPDEAAFMVLQELGIGDWTKREDSSGSSRLGKLLDILEGWEGTKEGFNDGFGLLLRGMGSDWSPTFARRITPLLVKSRVFGGIHAVDIPLTYSREVITALILSSPIIDGEPALSITTSLAQPYLSELHPSDPLRAAFQPTTPPSFPTETPAERELSRFADSLQSPNNGYTHSLTPSHLLSVLAPELLHSLSTARQPPFGLAPVGVSQSQNLASASAFAGKVYSSHDFRSRAVAGEGPSGPIIGGAGLGISGNRGESRPASRHVDAYQAR
jgi:hypothetical protein